MAAQYRHCCPARDRGHDVVEALRQRLLNWHLEESRRLWVDDFRAVRGEKRGDLLLGAPGDRPKAGDVKSGQESMRIRRQLGVLRESQVVAVERGAVSQVTRT